jgi:hypothetical protein
MAKIDQDYPTGDSHRSCDPGATSAIWPAELGAVGQLERGHGGRAWSRSSAFQISASARFAAGWADFGSADSTLPILSKP